MRLAIGNKYVLDAKYRNHGVVILLRVGKHFCTVQDPDTLVEWDVMLNRLSEVDSGK